jgi:hypothetical protein
MGLALLNSMLILGKVGYCDIRLHVTVMVIRNPKVLAFDSDSHESVAVNGRLLLKQFRKRNTNGLYVGLPILPT